RGRVSTAPVGGGEFLVNDGVLTRTVAESAAVLDLISGYVNGDAYWAPDPAEPFAATAGRAPGKLRIAATTNPPLDGSPLDDEAVRSVAVASEMLRGLGHEVEEVDPPWHMPDVLRMFTAVFGPLVSLNIAFAELVAGREAVEED